MYCTRINHDDNCDSQASRLATRSFEKDLWIFTIFAAQLCHTVSRSSLFLEKQLPQRIRTSTLSSERMSSRTFLLVAALAVWSADAQDCIELPDIRTLLNTAFPVWNVNEAGE